MMYKLSWGAVSKQKLFGNCCTGCEETETYLLVRSLFATKQEVEMGGGDGGCGNELLGVISNKQVTFPQMEQHLAFELMHVRGM